MSTVATVERPQPSITAAMAERYGMRTEAFEATLRATVVPKETTREEFAAFLMVAKEYGLNPLTREVYAFPKRGGGIQPILAIDGWCRIVNDNPAFDGMAFEDHYDTEGNLSSITCRIWRKDRSHPTEAKEYMNECRRNTDTWRQWPARMLRHKSLIQAARYAFGFSGVIDPDEAERWAQVGALSTEKPKGRPRLAVALEQAAQPPRPPAQEPDEPPIDEPTPENSPLDDEWGPGDNMAKDTGTRDDEEGEPAMEAYDDERTRLYAAGLAAANQSSRRFKFWRAKQVPEELAKLTPEDIKQLELIAKEADKQAPADG